VLLGLQVAAGCRPTPAAASRQLGPTAMRPELAAVSASLAAVQPGDCVLDPFCGSGSLLVAALDRGAGLAVGSDIDASHFPECLPDCPPLSPETGSRLPGDSSTPPSLPTSSGPGFAPPSTATSYHESSRLRSSSSRPPWPVYLQADVALLGQLMPAACVDAVLTDLPYGFRTTVAAAAGAAAATSSSSGSDDGDGAAGSPAQPGAAEKEWEVLLGVLLALAEHVLVPGGRLLVWMPLTGSAGVARGGSSSDINGSYMHDSSSAVDSSRHNSSGRSRSSERQDGQGGRDAHRWVAQERRVRAWAARRQLCLLHFMPESRLSGYPRAAALFQQAGGAADEGSGSGSGNGQPGGRREALLSALRAAAATLPAHNLPEPPLGQACGPYGGDGRELPAREQPQGQQSQLLQEQQQQPPEAAPGGVVRAPLISEAVQQRGRRYKEVRRAAAGAAIDVWRCVYVYVGMGGGGAGGQGHQQVLHLVLMAGDIVFLGPNLTVGPNQHCTVHAAHILMLCRRLTAPALRMLQQGCLAGRHSCCGRVCGSWWRRECRGSQGTDATAVCCRCVWLSVYLQLAQAGSELSEVLCEVGLRLPHTHTPTPAALAAHCQVTAGTRCQAAAQKMGACMWQQLS
jgi:hypothetical protein